MVPESVPIESAVQNLLTYQLGEVILGCNIREGALNNNLVSMMVMMFIGTEKLVTPLVCERSRLHADWTEKRKFEV